MLSFVLSTPWPFSFITSKCLCNENCPLKIDTVIKIENESRDCSLINRLNLSIHLSSKNSPKQAGTHCNACIEKVKVTFIPFDNFFLHLFVQCWDVSWQMLYLHWSYTQAMFPTCSFEMDASKTWWHMVIQMMRKLPFKERSVIKVRPTLLQKYIILTDLLAYSKLVWQVFLLSSLQSCNFLLTYIEVTCKYSKLPF